MINSIVQQGKIGADVDVRKTKNGNDMAIARLAVYLGKDKETGEPITQWFNVRAFGYAVDGLSKLCKGETAIVSGELEKSIYTDQDGNVRENLGIVASRVTRVESKYIR